MAKRDFSGESFFNLLFRAFRFLISRFRGRFYSFLNMFHKDSSKNIIIGRMSRFINSKYILFKKNVSFGDNLRIECFNCKNKEPMIIIGNNTSFGDNLHIGSTNKIYIGNDVLGASKILIIDHNHGTPKNLIKEGIIEPKNRELTSNGSIYVGNNVWIGENVIILAGTYIKDGALIPANSIVRGNVEKNTIFSMSNEK